MPHASWVVEIVKVLQNAVEVRYNMDSRTLSARAALPCLLSVEKDSFVPRMPSLKLKISGKKKEIHLLGIHDFIDQEEEHYGLKGSATRVKKIFPPERTKRQDVAALERKEAAEYILNILAVDRQEEQR